MTRSIPWLCLLWVGTLLLIEPPTTDATPRNFQRQSGWGARSNITLAGQRNLLYVPGSTIGLYFPSGYIEYRDWARPNFLWGFHLGTRAIFLDGFDPHASISLGFHFEGSISWSESLRFLAGLRFHFNHDSSTFYIIPNTITLEPSLSFEWFPFPSKQFSLLLYAGLPLQFGFLTGIAFSGPTFGIGAYFYSRQRDKR